MISIGFGWSIDTAVFALVVSALSLITSASLFIVHYINQKERRHGEITGLISDFLVRLDIAHQRLISFQMHQEMMGKDIQHLCDSCDNKCEFVKIIPEQIGDTQELVGGVNEIKVDLKNIDTRTSNNGKTLLMLQSIESRIRLLEIDTNRVEQDALSLLKKIALQRKKLNNRTGKIRR